MYKQDFLQKIIEYFFSTIRKLIKLDIEVRENNFDEQCNNLFLKTFGINLYEIKKIDRIKYSSIIHNEANKNDLVYILLKIAESNSKSNPQLALEYLNFSEEIWNMPSKLFHFENENSKKEINELLKNLKKLINN